MNIFQKFWHVLVFFEKNPEKMTRAKMIRTRRLTCLVVAEANTILDELSQIFRNKYKYRQIERLLMLKIALAKI